MSEQLYSPLWYRVADLQPALVAHAEVHRHSYRGETWYILQDRLSGRVHRLTPAAHHFVALMDGTRTVQEAWDLAETALGDAAPTQEEAIRILSQLHASDMLKADVTPDLRELFQRAERSKRRKWQQRLFNPLSQRFPLFDPDPLLDRLAPILKVFIGPLGVLIWLATVVPAIVLTAMHWPELSGNVAGQILTPSGIVLLALCFPVIKALHEFGHACVAKAWGCEVHEMGVMLLVLMPVPYVEASSTAALRDKRKRMSVAAAGILVEVFIAALALYVWLAVEPGLTRTLAFNIALIGGVSTVLFNGNPLLRFDGYYVFSDALEIPNLATRANAYIAYLVQKHLFRIASVRAPAAGASERAWLFGYAVMAFCYRLWILFAIVLFIAGEFFVVGVILAIWAVVSQLFLPVAKRIAFVVSSPLLDGRRGQAATVSAVLFMVVAGLLFAVPFPLVTTSEGVVWTPENGEVRAGADGVVVRLIATPNSIVQVGDPLIEIEDPLLPHRVEILEAELAEARSRFEALRTTNPVQADIVKVEMGVIDANLDVARERLASLVIRSPASGVFLIDRPPDWPGQFVRHGDLVAYVADVASGTVRVAVAQEDIGLIRQQTRTVSVRLADRLDETLQANISREVPLASERLPSAALGTTGGGTFVVDPTKTDGVHALQKVFQLELGLEQPVTRIGGRVYVRFDLGSEPLGLQWLRRARQLFLSQFHV